MMTALKRLSIAVPALLLLSSLIGLFLTRGSMANLPASRSRGGPRNTADSLVDQRPWQTIEALAPLAVSAEEKRLAREAERLADHTVDQAFAQALRQAVLDTHPVGGNAAAIQQKADSLQTLVKEDQNKVNTLTAAAKAATANAPVNPDDLDAAKAQLQLDSDELADANQELARLSGDNRDQIQRELTARQAAMKKFDEQAESAGTSAVQTAKSYRTLAGRISALFDQGTRMDSIAQAKAQADEDVKTLTAQQTDVESKLSANSTANGADTQAMSRIARLNQMHTLSQIHSILEDRIQTEKQLSSIYGRWGDQVKRQRGIVVHLALQSLAFIAFLLLCSALVNAGVSKLLERLKVDRRTLHTLRTIATLAIQFVTLLMVILAIFGVPSQMPTIIGLATAGITVVFQDFILAFFGWFILMGKNGIRVGDWVEISGIGGEVVEVGLFRTSLLETGNWTDQGHPTGRRVNFMNSFAISGQYFNFSTSSQWLWDEIRLNLPATPETPALVERIREAITKETADSVKQAETEWQRATRQQGLSQFTAEPSIDLRPAAAGVDIIIRYIARASDRFSIRNRIYQSLLGLMQKEEPSASLVSGEKTA
jgi:small-conductance mechanosensitive channel